MSIHARPLEFSKPALAMTGDARLIEQFGLSATQESLQEFNRQNDPALAGRYIAGISRNESNAHGANHTEKEKRDENFARAMNSVQMQSLSIDRMLDRLSVGIQNTLSWLSEDKELAQTAHLDAAQKVMVSPKDVIRDPLTGQPMTLEQKLQFDAQNRSCAVGLTTDQLVLDDMGRPLMDASGSQFFDKRMQKRMDDALETAQENDAYIQKIEAGEMTFSDLPKDKQISLLQNQSLETKQRLYEEAGYTPEQVAEMNELTKPKATGLLADLEDAGTALQYTPAALQSTLKLAPGF